jgi:hypothetical protein
MDSKAKKSVIVVSAFGLGFIFLSSLYSLVFVFVVPAATMLFYAESWWQDIEAGLTLCCFGSVAIFVVGIICLVVALVVYGIAKSR